MRYLAIALLALLMSGATTMAAELVYVELKGCPHCARFNREMAKDYSSSEAGKRARLRPVDLMKKWPSDLAAVKSPPYSPVFILVDHGKELGRFEGYINPRQFGREVKRLLRRLESRRSKS